MKSVLSIVKNMIWGEEEEGYDSLIRSSIYQKVQILKENRHVEFGLLVSGVLEYILKEIYSGSIQQDSSDIL